VLKGNAAMTLQLLPCPSCERVTALTVAVRPDDKLRCPHCGGEFLFSTLFREPRAHWEIIPRNGQPHATAGTKTIDQTVESAGALTISVAEPAFPTPGRDTIYDSHDLLRDIVVPSGTPQLEHNASHAQSPERDSQFGQAHAEQDSRAGEHYEYHNTGEQYGNTAEDMAAARGTAIDNADRSSNQASTQLAKNAAWSHFQPLTPDFLDRQRRARRTFSIWPVIQVALGGVAAVPVALLLVWHLIGTDVGEAGPWVGKFVPWIVPEKFRPYQSLTPDQSLDAKVEVPRSTSPPSGSGLPKVASQELAEPEEATAMSDSAPPATDQFPASTDTSVPLFENVFAIIRQTTEHVDDYAAAARRRDVDLRSLALATYRELSNLALVIHKLPPDSTVLRAVRRQLKPLGQQVIEDAEVQRLIAQGAPYWITTQARQPQPENSDTAVDTTDPAEPTDQSYGLAMLVTVDQADEITSLSGSWWQIVPSSSSHLGDPPLEIRIPRDVALSLSGGQIVAPQKLFLLGTVRRALEKAKTSGQLAPVPPTFVAQYAVAY